MKKINTKLKIVSVLMVILILIVLFFQAKASVDRKNAENSQIDIEILQEFPYDTDMAGVCEWLDQKGFSYKLKNSTIENVSTPNGWKLNIWTEQNDDRLHLSLHQFSKDNYLTIYQRTQEQLEELLGTPAITPGGLSQWTLNNSMELYVNYHLNSGQVNINISPLKK